MKDVLSDTIISKLPTHIRAAAIQQVIDEKGTYEVYGEDVCVAAIDILIKYWDLYHDDDYLRRPDVATCELCDALSGREGVETLYVDPYESQNILVDGPATVYVVID